MCHVECGFTIFTTFRYIYHTELGSSQAMPVEVSVSVSVSASQECHSERVSDCTQSIRIYSNSTLLELGLDRQAVPCTLHHRQKREKEFSSSCREKQTSAMFRYIASLPLSTPPSPTYHSQGQTDSLRIITHNSASAERRRRSVM